MKKLIRKALKELDIETLRQIMEEDNECKYGNYLWAKIDDQPNEKVVDINGTVSWKVIKGTEYIYDEIWDIFESYYDLSNVIIQDGDHMKRIYVRNVGRKHENI